jgi:two-component system sensor histidine kinase KdpD
MDRPEGEPADSRDSGAVLRSCAISTVEILVAVGLATAAVALLESTAPPAGLGIVYLLAVLMVAIRRGQIPALVAAVLSVLILNYLFITPRHRLEIAHSQDVVELAVLLIAAVVVGRLAALSRQRAAVAELRAREATAREREAELLADAAAATLARRSLDAQLDSIAGRVALATGASRATLILGPSPPPQPGEFAVRLPLRSGQAWLLVSGDSDWDPALIKGLAGPLGGLVDVAVERERVAEQAADAEAARRAEVAKTAVLHAISHDLRSPLTAITTASAALRSPGVTPGEREELMDAIEAEGARLARLVDDLLDLSRIEAGALDPQQDWCDLGDVVASAASRFDGDRQLQFHLPPELPLIRADAAQLERVFANLIDNAVKFSPPGAPVEIRGGTAGGRVTVRVIDHGRGISREDRQHIFEPFFRGRGDATPGSGLGLAICRGFVEANGGRIILQPGLEDGSSFAVSFPVASPLGGDEPEAPGDGYGVSNAPGDGDRLGAAPGDGYGLGSAPGVGDGAAETPPGPPASPPSPPSPATPR